MNINRNNYQEFLLLYIDGELSAELEKEVDAFLESNADIKQEFDDLLNTKLQLEDVSFGDISSLLKFEEKSIGINNYEEKFLLYVDNELSNQEKQSVETFVLQHPTLQSSFTTLKNTVLPLEIIQYTNKEELYKKERKPIIFYLQRVAVAAVFIGFVAFIWNLNSSNKTTTETVAIQPNKSVTSTNITATNKNSENSDVKENTVAIINAKEVKNIATVVVKKVQPEKQKIENNLTATVTKNAQQSLTNQSSISQTNQPSINNTQTLVSNNTITNNSSVNNNNIPATIAVNNTNNNAQNTSSYAAKQVIYKSLDGDDENSKSTLVTGEEVKASKLMGLFKKAMKVITPKESDDNDSKKLLAVTL